MNPIFLIPARMASTRLPGKPMALIAGQPMIVHVLRRVQEAALGRATCGRIIVATSEQEIADAVSAAGGEAILTDPALPSGTDRIAAALRICDPSAQHDVVVNVQGDLPTLPPHYLSTLLEPLRFPEVDIATLGAPIHSAEELAAPSVVKIAMTPLAKNMYRALYFSRAPIPDGAGTHTHHIGLYAYRRAALDRFTALPPSPLEQQERLEQLRALEAGMTIAVSVVDEAPFGVDTPEDLARVRNQTEAL